MILCLGSAADETFLHTLQALSSAGHELEAVDFAHLVLDGGLTVPVHDPLEGEIRVGETRVRLGDADGVYVRLFDIGAAAPDPALARRARAHYHALNRVLSALPIPVLNPPVGDASNFTKLFHSVALAREHDLLIPRSCLTSDPGEARAFAASCPGGALFKGASARKTWATVYDPGLHEARLPLLANAPALLQERIVGPDVRVHVVGSRAFAERIESEHVDYRTRRDNRYVPCSLSTDIENACVRLGAALDAPFLGVDFKVADDDGSWFFLEANSMPCYQGYDRRAGGAIGRAIADWLANGLSPRAAAASSASSAPSRAI